VLRKTAAALAAEWIAPHRVRWETPSYSASFGRSVLFRAPGRLLPWPCRAKLHPF